MDFLTWGRNPWSQDVLIRISWDLLYLSAIAGVLFLVGHAVYVKMRPKTVARPTPEEAARTAALEHRLPQRIPRHSMAARMFHWVMAAAMFTLLFTGLLPIVGIRFGWVTIHWIAGIVLTASVIYHIVHATFWLDFWSIWIGPADVREGWQRFSRAMSGKPAEPRKDGKYPVDNKMYHTIIVLAGFAAILTGIFMMYRIRTPFLPRDPYLFSDQTWGWMYVLHGLAGVGLVSLVMAHVYFAVRPEKFWITKSMIFGWISRRHYLEHHDPNRWVVPTEPPQPAPSESKRATA